MSKALIRYGCLGIAHDDLRAEGKREVAKVAADVAVADHTQCRVLELSAQRRRQRAAGAIRGGRIGDPTAQVDHRADHPFGHAGNEPRTRARDENALLARRLQVDIADIDRAARECDQRGRPPKQLGRTGRLTVGDDERASGRHSDQLIGRERTVEVIDGDLAKSAQARKRPVAVVVGASAHRKCEKDARHGSGR